ncbi:Alpha/Beta hydrolase protein [Xylaria arbuscula]|nr:Alpha/Beta hydrolase protein [Xylaria arbuscula]
MHHGAKLAAKGITVVTANYRLGRFGELALEELSAESGHGASGNYGIMDQIAVLQWVKRNIKAFGGDPDNVTVGGASAGGASTSVLRISPFAKGLFAKAICESGPGLAPVVDGPGSIAVYTTLSAAEKVGAELIGVLDVTSLDELRKLPADSIRSASLSSTAGDWVSYLRPNATGLNTYDTSYPIVDGYVIPESPLTAFQAGNITDVPLLAGNPLNDGTALPHLDTLAKYDAFLNEMFGDQAADAKRVYPATTDAEAYNSSWDLLVDQVFVYPTWTAARLQAKTLESPSWYYRFDRAPPIPANSSILEKDFAGAYHTAGALYAFGNLESRPWDWTSGDWELSADLMDSYVRFMTTGNPDAATAQNGTDSWLPLKTGGDLIRSFDIGGGGVERQLASINEMSAFWDGFYGVGM